MSLELKEGSLGIESVVRCNLLGEGIARGIFEVISVPKVVLNNDTDLFEMLDNVKGRHISRNNKYFKGYIYLFHKKKITIKMLHKMRCKYWVFFKIL